MTKAIIFDLDETLVNRQATMENFLLEQYQRFQDSLTLSATTFITENLLAQNNGYTEKLEAYGHFCRKHSQNESLATQLYADYIDHYGHGAILFTGVLELLEDLSKGFTLAMITNGKTLCQNRKIDGTGIRSFFKTIKISEEEGISKPEKSIFLNCIQDLEIEAEHCLFIGDHPVNDIVPAHELGMRTVWVESDKYDAPPEADSVVKMPSELLALVSSPQLKS
jgi:putative hydrolase of the HAD superfamily